MSPCLLTMSNAKQQEGLVTACLPAWQVGVAFFKEKPTALYPYSEMDMQQRYYVEKVVTACMDHHQKVVLPPGGAAHADCSEDSQCSAKSPCKVIMQMGGGCILYMEEMKGESSVKHDEGRARYTGNAAQASPTLLQASHVMRTICDCVFASTR